MLRNAIAIALLCLMGCAPAPAPKSVSIAPLVEEFVYGALGYSPVAAAAAGLHSRNGVSFDEALDQFDAASLAKYRQFLEGFRARLEKEVKPENLAPEERADYDIIAGQIRLALLELDTLQAYRHNPTVYVELAGSALFNPFVLEYAPLEQRFGHIIARLEKLPVLFDQARANLVDSPEIWTKVAIDENEGNLALINGVLSKQCPPVRKEAFEKAKASALKAITAFNQYLSKDLAKKTSGWRLGKEKYAAKFAAVLDLGVTPDQLLADAESELARVRTKMLGTGGPMFERMYPGEREPENPSLLVSKVLAKVAERRSARERYFDDARRDLDEARSFVRAKNLMKLPARDNLQVIETPVFMRGIYAVGGFNPAPALEPKLGAFYWLTPIPDDWPKERVDSKLREYNFYGLKILTIHEAIPGHYLQFEYANDVQPEARRVLRSVFGNGPNVEGWAVYATDLLIEQGYLEDDPRMLMTWYKQYLRAVANTILDIRMQSMGMTDEEAVKLMIEQTFQEKEEATAKLVRAKLSSTQLPTYFAGYRAWRRLRDRIEKSRGAAFQLASFHEEALKPGAIPMPSLERIMGK